MEESKNEMLHQGLSKTTVCKKQLGKSERNLGFRV